MTVEISTSAKGIRKKHEKKINIREVATIRSKGSTQKENPERTVCENKTIPRSNSVKLARGCLKRGITVEEFGVQRE